MHQESIKTTDLHVGRRTYLQYVAELNQKRRGTKMEANREDYLILHSSTLYLKESNSHHNEESSKFNAFCISGSIRMI